MVSLVAPDNAVTSGYLWDAVPAGVLGEVGHAAAQSELDNQPFASLPLRCHGETGFHLDLVLPVGGVIVTFIFNSSHVIHFFETAPGVPPLTALL